MESLTIQMAVLAILQFFGKAVEGVSKKVGEKTGEQVYKLLKERFKKDSYEDQALERLKEKPDSSKRERVFKAVLCEIAEEDELLALKLAEILQPNTSQNQSSVSANQQVKYVKGNVNQEIDIRDVN